MLLSKYSFALLGLSLSVVSLLSVVIRFFSSISKLVFKFAVSLPLFAVFSHTSSSVGDGILAVVYSSSFSSFQFVLSIVIIYFPIFLRLPFCFLFFRHFTLLQIIFPVALCYFLSSYLQISAPITPWRFPTFWVYIIE